MLLPRQRANIAEVKSPEPSIGKSRRLVEIAGKIRAGDVRQVMFHPHDLETAIRFRHAASFRDHLLDAVHLHAPLKMRHHAARGFQRRLEHMPDFGRDICVAVIADGDAIHVADGGAGHAQYFGNGAAGKTGDVLVPWAQPFLGDGGDQFAVLQRTGGGIGVKCVEAEDQIHKNLISKIRNLKSNAGERE